MDRCQSVSESLTPDDFTIHFSMFEKSLICVNRGNIASSTYRSLVATEELSARSVRTRPS